MPVNFIPTIGLEIHAQISTKTKLFCSCDNDSFDKEPNINTCPICMGFPGTLPVLNQEALKKAIMASLALNCKINNFSRFDRKNYFYPDLPSGFQISQYEQPLAEKGNLHVKVENAEKNIGITRLHVENDAGKLTHVQGGTLCDYNRSGTPLMEIVSEPDMTSAREAVAYAKEIQKIVRAIDSSDADMEKGMMRFDINVSLKKPEDKQLGVKVEVKNLNSFRSLEKALEYEIVRQTELLQKGESIIQETRGFDAEKEITVSQRVKEQAHDYRYFPEPDLPPMQITDEDMEKLKNALPELPAAKKERYKKDYNLQEHYIETLLEDPDLAKFFEELAKLTNLPQKSISWTNDIILNLLKKEKNSIKEAKIKAPELAYLIKAIENNEISNLKAKEEIFPEMWETGEKPEIIIEKKGLKQVNDLSSLEQICDQIIAENQKAVEDLKNGNDRSLGFLIGQGMAKSKGKANPKILSEIIKRKINQ